MSEAGALEAPDEAIDPGAMIAALRERGAADFDPIRFRFIEALARRGAAHGGEVRLLLDGKLAKALAAYRERFEQGQAPAASRPEEDDSSSPLAELIAYIGQHGAAEEEGAARGVAAASFGELKSLRQFRATWSKLSVDQQLTQALAQGPENAGPLNSHLLVLRSLELMRDISPDYLSRFMSYVDTLLWLELADSANGPARTEAAERGDAGRKSKSGRGRSGRD